MEMSDQLMKEIDYLSKTFFQEIKNCNNNEDVKLLKSKFLGKKSRLFELISTISKMSHQMKQTIGKKCTILKKSMEEKINSLTFQRVGLIDYSLPVNNNNGSLHALSITKNRVQSILLSMGLKFIESPEIESEWRNFECLNIGKKHPARENHHSFFLENNMLRTHTSSIQSYVLENLDNKKSKFFTIGRVFRNDHDSTHLPMFHQIECFVIEKMANLQYMLSFIQSFLDYFFERKMRVRKRPSFFPFTNFSMEIDIWMDGKWLEILGCGIIHSNIFHNCGIQPLQGFAFGCGLERIHMLKNNINDIRNLYSKDANMLKFLGDITY